MAYRIVKDVKKEVEELFVNNEHYFHGYTGTPMLKTRTVIPKILEIIDALVSEAFMKGRADIHKGTQKATLRKFKESCNLLNKDRDAQVSDTTGDAILTDDDKQKTQFNETE